MIKNDKRLHIRLSEKNLKFVKYKAKKEDLTVSQYIRKLINKEFEEEKWKYGKGLDNFFDELDSF